MMEEQFAYKLPLVFEPQPDGGYTVTCPILPELITEGDTIAEALTNAKDALTAIIEAYADLGRSLPPVLKCVALDLHTPFWIETAVAV
jgi:antitoxin HicB